jgi:hypothetical protein
MTNDTVIHSLPEILFWWALALAFSSVLFSVAIWLVGTLLADLLRNFRR